MLVDIKLDYPVEILVFHGPGASRGLLALSHRHFPLDHLLHGLEFFREVFTDYFDFLEEMQPQKMDISSGDIWVSESSPSLGMPEVCEK